MLSFRKLGMPRKWQQECSVKHHTDFPVLNAKTIFNFVHWVRGNHNTPKLSLQRQHSVVEELPYGNQAQVDFGEYNLRKSTGVRVKVFLFTLVLSRSRYKYYDQDKVFIVSENSGDIILTDVFRSYTRDKSFKLYFCRKADPQSNGKVALANQGKRYTVMMPVFAQDDMIVARYFTFGDMLDFIACCGQRFQHWFFIRFKPLLAAPHFIFKSAGIEQLELFTKGGIELFKTMKGLIPQGGIL